jgi:hypothetical protein
LSKDRFGINRVVLLPPRERLHIGRRDQLRVMSEVCELASPVMRSSACLQRHGAARMPGEKIEQLSSTDLSAEQSSTARIRAVGMKNILRDIQTDRGNF